MERSDGRHSLRLEVRRLAGERVTGGGGNNIATPGVDIIQNAPRPASNNVPATGWQLTYQNTTASARMIFAYVMCMVP